MKQDFTCFEEISREVTLEAKRQGIDQLFLSQPLLFSELLLTGRKKQHQEALSLSKNIVFLDRGLPDVLAYMHFIGDSYPPEFDQICKDHRYTKIFILPPWKEIYTADEARYENFEQACLIYEHLKETYTYFGYELIEIPKGTVEERLNFVKSNI
jgi:predicted ATPase